jgi:hypothetical protein
MVNSAMGASRACRQARANVQSLAREHCEEAMADAVETRNSSAFPRYAKIFAADNVTENIFASKTSRRSPRLRSAPRENGGYTQN